ncbi:MAG: hypothetical protein IKL80_03550 [Clostridia bacterium]|nr:hypothetical protein [Clostridia bacterium]
MEKKSKKKIIILSVIAVILIGGITAGYIAINKMFSIFSDSFYQVSVPEDDDVPQDATAPPEVDADNEGKGEEIAGEQTGTNPSAKPPTTATNKPKATLPIEGKDISAETSKELMDEVSFSDKLSVIGILNENLSASEYREMVGMLSGGITADEIKRAKEILKESLPKEDKKKIKAYYKKYEDLLE